jgi:hypothetical protein
MMAKMIDLEPIPGGWRVEVEDVRVELVQIRSGQRARGLLQVARLDDGDWLPAHLDNLALDSASARARFVKAAAAAGARVEETWLLRLYERATAEPLEDEPARAPRGQVRLSGAQSVVDGTLVYVLRFDDDDSVAVMTSDGEVLDEQEAGQRYRLEPPDVPARLSRHALEGYAAGARRGPPLDGALLLCDLEALLLAHVEWPSKPLVTLVATWILATYLHAAFDYFPYLALTSLTKRSGKSRALEVLAELAWQATPPQTSPTPAAVFRQVHVNTCTLLVDEVEGLGDKDSERRAELLSVLNLGFKAGNVVPRVQKDGDGFQIQQFRVFGPKAFAGIRDMADTVRDRSLALRFLRKAQSTKLKRFRLRSLRTTLQDLRDRCHLWALHYAADVIATYDDADTLPLPEDCDDRLRDILEPLFAVAAVIDRDDEIEATTDVLIGAAKEQIALRSEDPGDQTIRLGAAALLKLLDAAPPPRERVVLRSDDAVGPFADAGLEWVKEAKHAQSALRKLGFKSQSTRDDKGQPVRGYVITRARVDELVRRYPEAGEDGPRDASDESDTGKASRKNVA